MGKCKYCGDVVGKVDLKVPPLKTKKPEMKKIRQLAILRSKSEVCEYCYLQQLAILTTIMRVKAESGQKP